MIDSGNDPLWAFVEKHVTSFAKWDALVFFASNPDGTETGLALSEKLARREDEVHGALEELADGAVLERAGKGHQGPPAYHLTRDAGMRLLVDRFVSSTRSREARLQVLTHLLRAGAH